MGFQGFARDERFSDNQIRIDIASVIDSDLKEANRQSRLAGKNASLAEKWNGMYLNALVNKHEVEKRNREENFASFMKNREEIQKIVQYNNEGLKAGIRELHVYGAATGIGDKGSVQHRGLGTKLMKTAEEIVGENRIKKVAVISGIGVKGYYQKLGYQKEGIYMVKTFKDNK